MHKAQQGLGLGITLTGKMATMGRIDKAPRQGTELSANSSENRGVAGRGGAESGALSGDSFSGGALPALTDPDLLAVVNAWPGLPEATRQSIVAMVQASTEAGGNDAG
jgi:hypothetical protein